MITEKVAPIPVTSNVLKPKRAAKLKVITTVREMQATAERWRRTGKKIGLVPTMGALHEGHAALIREARKACDRVVVSVYVNPMQFGPQEDFSAYPRDLKRDVRLAGAEKSDAVFAPSDQEMYAPGFDTRVLAGEKLTQVLCGETRPGHFTGVATVVSKLLLAARPHSVFFGQKDYQQVLVIRRLLLDLNFGCELVMLPTVREADGLAKSSRNAYLSEEERRAAPAIYQALKLAESMLQVGERNPKDLLEAVKKRIKSEPLIDIEYISAKNAQTLEDLNILAGQVLVAVAARLGKTRLIDNVIVDVPLGS